jgi:hypothetical protein
MIYEEEWEKERKKGRKRFIAAALNDTRTQT